MTIDLSEQEALARDSTWREISKLADRQMDEARGIWHACAVESGQTTHCVAMYDIRLAELRGASGVSDDQARQLIAQDRPFSVQVVDVDTLKALIGKGFSAEQEIQAFASLGRVAFYGIRSWCSSLVMRAIMGIDGEEIR